MPVSCLLPSEWAPQSAVLLTWPHAGGDWADNLDAAEHCFAEMGREISRRQTLIVSCNDPAKLEDVRRRLTAARADMRRVQLYAVPSNDVWVRDHGPITVLRYGQPYLLKFRFNGWGGKYEHARDNQVALRLREAGAFGNTPMEEVSEILEGGGIDSNGAGALLCTSRCLLSTTRNPHLGRRGTEDLLKKLFGLTQVHWIEHGGLEGDDTDGHIDTLARFCSADTIVYQSCADPDDVHYADLAAMHEELRALRQSDGQAYRLLPLPWPRAQYGDDGRRLPATYANFLPINGAVLMPFYADPADETARQVLQDCFPDSEIIGIDCRALIRQNGSLHCATMQLPAGVVP